MANNQYGFPEIPPGGLDPNYGQIQNLGGDYPQFIQYTDPQTGAQTQYGMPASGSPWASQPYVNPQDDPKFNPYAPGGKSWRGGGGAGGMSSGNSKTFGWQQPGRANYNPIVADPFYIQQTGLLNANWIAQQAQAQEQAQQALIRFGSVPGALDAQNPWVTDLVRQLAQQNTDAGLSTIAQIQHSADLARRNSINDLAARGMLQSGETGYQLGELGLQRSQAEYGATQSLLDYLRGVQAALTQSGFQTQAGMGQAALDATQRVSAQNQQAYGGR